MPARWRRIGSGARWVTWGSPDHRTTVTLSYLPAAGEPLERVVAMSLDGLRRELRGVRDAQVGSATLPDGSPAAVSSLRAGARDERLQVVQAWRRDRARGVDMVATWTSTRGGDLAARASLPAPAGHSG